MKIKNTKKYNNRLIKLQILKLYYKKKSHNFEHSLKQIELHLNKVSHIIYNYHISNKKILFIGFPKNLKKTLKKTKHSFIPKYQWLNGMLSNRNYNNKQKNIPNNIIKLFLKLKKKIDLVIIHDLDKESTAIEEAFITRTPVISVNTKFKITNIFPTYEFLGHFNLDHEKKSKNNLCFSIIKIALKRAGNLKKIKSMISTKNRKYKPSYKKFIRLRVDPINNDKILRFKKKKWKTFLIHLKIRNSYYKIYKPFSHYNYSITKFASQGNSFKRKFRNDLIARQTFNYFYGDLRKKALKNNARQIYNSAQFRNYKRIFLELFESRLDSVLYRSKFTNSIKEAKQLIAHKHVKVNNRVEKNRSYILHKGDLVQIDTYASKIIKKNLRKQPTKNVIFTYRDKTTKKNTTKKIKKQIWPIPPKYLTINYNTLEIIFGDLKNVNFSTLFPFKLNVDSIVTSYYRH